MTPLTLSSPDSADAELVVQSIAGNRDAFGRIVTRYQSLVCALAYSATGSRTRSEDLAQETFLTAWRKLPDLREPGRLRSWLCGIARNIIHGDRRRLERQPTHEADPLNDALDLPSTEAAPTAQAVSNEEMAILWREVGRLPEIYREPLILFYREHQSVERVAAALELTPDAVMQRLTRGRRQLAERMLVFIESTLQRSNPGPEFALQIQAVLPLVAGSASATTLGVAAKGSSAAAKSGGLGAVLAWATPFIGLFAAMGISWTEIAQAATKRERRFAARWALVLWLTVAGFIAAMYGAGSLVRTANLADREDWIAAAPFVAVWFGFAMIVVTLIVLMLRGKAALRRQMITEGAIPALPVAISTKKRVALVAGFLTATFWVPLFVAWQSGDRKVAGAIAGGVVLLGVAPFLLGRMLRRPVREDFAGGWYISLGGLIFLGILNWRLDVWLVPMYRGNLALVHQILPMSLLHWLSAVIVAWTAALVFITQNDRKR